MSRNLFTCEVCGVYWEFIYYMYILNNMDTVHDVPCVSTTFIHILEANYDGIGYSYDLPVSKK